MIHAITKSATDTTELAAQLVPLLRDGDMILVSGDLGAGKTTFTQGLGRALGITEPITSPTFVMIHSYEGKLLLHHIDLYRIEQLQEVIDLGIGEMLDDGGVAVVEWGDLGAPVMPRDYLSIRFDQTDDDDQRKVRFDAVGSGWLDRIGEVRDAVSRWTVDSTGGES